MTPTAVLLCSRSAPLAHRAISEHFPVKLSKSCPDNSKRMEGFGRIFALYSRLSTSCQICEDIRCLYFRNDDAAEPHLDELHHDALALRVLEAPLPAAAADHAHGLEPSGDLRGPRGGEPIGTPPRGLPW